MKSLFFIAACYTDSVEDFAFRRRPVSFLVASAPAGRKSVGVQRRGGWHKSTHP
jgi:hypothetical protein